MKVTPHRVFLGFCGIVILAAILTGWLFADEMDMQTGFTILFGTPLAIYFASKLLRIYTEFREATMWELKRQLTLAVGLLLLLILLLIAGVTGRS